MQHYIFFLACIYNLTAILVHFKLLWLIESARCIFEQEMRERTHKQEQRNSTLESFYHIWPNSYWINIISSCLKFITTLITQLKDTTTWLTMVTAISRERNKNNSQK